MVKIYSWLKKTKQQSRKKMLFKTYSHQQSFKKIFLRIRMRYPSTNGCWTLKTKARKYKLKTAKDSHNAEQYQYLAMETILIKMNTFNKLVMH